MNTRTRPTSRISAMFAALVAAFSLASGAQAQDLIISGTIDGPLTGGVPKAVEFYVVNDIADLSEYGVSSANNGGGPTGAPEFTFPAASATAGSYLYLATEAPNFTAFFGFAPDFTDGAAPSINGDDAIELFRNGIVVDVFGEVSTDGSGQPWEYTDGWAYRVSETGPDGSTFSLSSWFFSGRDALDGETTNATAAVPFPTGTFTKAAGDAAPRVIATTPAEGAANVPVDASIDIVFSEPVTVGGGGFDVTCSMSGALSATVSSTDSTTFTLDPGADFAEGETCTVTVLAALVSDIDTDDPPDAMAADFTLTFTTVSGGGLVINEILADPAGDITGDANGDGIRDGSEDEFVEIVNNTGAPVDLSGWTIADAVTVRHVFPSGTLIDPGCGIVVFGGGTPSGSFGGVTVQTASSGFLGFNNGGDTVTLADGAGTGVATVGYGSEGGQNQSLTRDPDLTGGFVGHTTVNGALFSPGTRTDGSAFDGCTVPVPSIIINEILADPAGDLTGDANGDGTRDGSEDEFVELVNDSGGDLDISGWTIADAVTTRHVFPAGTVLEAGCGAVVFGGGTPVGSFGGTVVQTASSGFLGFNNGGDTVTLRDAGGTDIATVGYGSEGGQNQSLTRNPDLTGGFVGHTSVNGALFSPGTRVDGAAFDGCTVAIELAIHEVQGAGNATPFEGQVVVVEGIVTGDLQNNDADAQNSIGGFYLQDAPADADADPATSDGIFVFDGNSPATDVQVGDRVRVQGEAVEFFGETQISADSVIVVSGGNSIAATPVTLPAADAIFVGGQYIPDLERYEGMLVTFPGTLYATDLFNLDRFGVIQLIDGGVPFQFTNFAEPDAVALDAYLRDIGTRTIMLDDGLTVQNPDPIRYPAPGLPNSVGAVVRTGDTVTGLTGNIRYSRGSGGSGEDFYRLMPTAEPQFVTENPRPASPPDVGGSMTVASFNVLNYFSTIDLPGNVCGPLAAGCRGADSDLEFERQQAKIVAAITELDADVVGLIELENSDGATLAVLVDALNGALGETVYDYIDTGFIGTDAIKVGLIYQPATVMPEGPFAVLDSSVDPLFLDDKNRPVLAQTFRELATGGVITVAVNHLKSKGSDCDDVGDPDTGDGQGNCNLTRTSAAIATVNWLATDPTGSGDDDFLVIGDLNAYLQEDPIDAYRDGGYTSLLETFIGPNPYTFVFAQQRGALDHALASGPLVPQVTGTGVWHINTDEADAIDYNLDFGRNPAIFEPTAFRASDHDPVIVGLDLIGDRDRDGVLNADDACPDTMIPEAVPTIELKPNHFALTDGDLIFDTGVPESMFMYTTIDTAGCSCEQIIAETGAGQGHTRFGCSNGLMEDWVEFVGN